MGSNFEAHGFAFCIAEDFKGHIAKSQIDAKPCLLSCDPVPYYARLASLVNVIHTHQTQ